MERAYDLDQREQQQSAQLQQENQMWLARFGAATLEIEQCKAALPKVQEKQRDLVNSAVQRHGIENFQSARIDGKHLVCQLADTLPITGPLEAQPLPVMDAAPVPVKPNSGAKHAKE